MVANMITHNYIRALIFEDTKFLELSKIQNNYFVKIFLRMSKQEAVELDHPTILRVNIFEVL